MTMGTRLALLAIVALAPTAKAQQPDSARADTAATLTELVVRARRPITSVGGSSGVAIALDSLPLPPAAPLERVLREAPFLHVRRNSRGEAEISARGSESRQVAVLVDGVPITLAWDARADVSIIPAAAPQRIEFTRGLSSMLYGPNVLGGIVEISVGRSLLQPSASSVEIGAGVDGVGGVGTRATMTLPFESSAGRWLIRAGAGFRDTPGQPLARGIVEPLPTDDGLRVNTDARSVDGFVAARFHGNDGAWLSFSGSSFDAKRGIAAELGTDDARFWRYPDVNRTVGVISGGTGDRASPFGGRGDLEASVGLDFGRTEIDSYTGRDYVTTDGFENGNDRTLTLRLLADQSLGSRGELRTAFTWSDIRHDEILPDAEARYRQQLASLGAETVWRLIEDGTGIEALRVSVGGAYDVGKTPESGGREPLGTLHQWGVRAGFSMVVGGGDALIHGGVSRRGRFPALRELYSGALNRFAPNPDLEPEKLTAFEAGVTTRLGGGEVQAVFFRHDLRDAVVRTTLPDRRFFRVNRDRLASTGLELLAATTVGRVGLSGDLTLQSVDLTDPEAQVTHEPENLPSVFGTVRAALPIGFGTVATAELDYTGRQFCIDPGTGQDTRLDAGAIVNGHVSKVWSVGRSGMLSRLETRIALDNLGDRALFDQCGLPRPGRLLRLELRLF